MRLTGEVPGLGLCLDPDEVEEERGFPAVILCERGVVSLAFAGPEAFLEDLRGVTLGDTERFLLSPVGGVRMGEESAERMCLLHLGGTALERRGGPVATVHAELTFVSRSPTSSPVGVALVESGRVGKEPEGANSGGEMFLRI